jgi:guanidinoacetate N-methyltransferase
VTRKLKRSLEFDVDLQIKDDNFIRPPRESQRNWLLNRAVAEFAGDLRALHDVAGRFVPGVEKQIIDDRTQTELSDSDIMEDWQIPLMQRMAAVVTETAGDVLEIGFGRGISAGFIQAGKPRSHTIVECNDSVVDRFQAWRQTFAEADIRLIYGRWQDVVNQMQLYDGIFFHTYPLSEEEYVDQVLKSTTFAEHFFPTAVAHLREGGVFTYMTNEIDSLSRSHQRLLFSYFSSFSLQLVPLALPPDVHDTWWADQMVVVKAVK